MSKTNSTVVITFSIAMFVLLILLLVLTYNSKCRMDNAERFVMTDKPLTLSDLESVKTRNLYSGEASITDRAQSKASEFIVNYDPRDEELAGVTNYAPPMTSLSQRAQDGIEGSDPLGNAFFGTADTNNANKFLETQLAGTCVARDRLTSADLLPLDANSKWAELNPQCSGDLQDQNYLTAGYHIGINTTGQSMRNANLQLRSEPPIKQLPVSPWGISTIEPDPKPMGLSDIGTSSL